MLCAWAGTSFIVTLRNYVDACEVKNATCVDPTWGGDDPALLLRLHRVDPTVPLTPFDRVRQETCKWRMTACNSATCVCQCFSFVLQASWHFPYYKCFQTETRRRQRRQ